MGSLLLKGTAIVGHGEIRVDICEYEDCDRPVNPKYQQFCSRVHQNRAYNKTRPRKTERRRKSAA